MEAVTSACSTFIGPSTLFSLGPLWETTSTELIYAASKIKGRP
jgi:hypothetical protein